IAAGVILNHCLTLLCGLTFAFFGYRLFCAGFNKAAGEMKTTYGKASLVLRDVAPGVFFALFGAVIVAISVSRGIRYETGRTAVPVLNSGPASTATSPQVR